MATPLTRATVPIEYFLCRSLAIIWRPVIISAARRSMISVGVSSSSDGSSVNRRRIRWIVACE
ncbi:Uncharacterised protein [Mycobacteroides abscessus subsp. abscessus]|nr:Uncharacterised protein [Mycobacteroides abscessus subsp. abscessus]